MGHGHLEAGKGVLEGLEGADMLFHLFATACKLCNWFDNLGRVGDVWGVYGRLLTHKGLLVCHLSAALCLMSFMISYTGFCTLAILELLAKSAIAFGSLGFLACFLFGFRKLA